MILGHAATFPPLALGVARAMRVDTAGDGPHHILERFQGKVLAAALFAAMRHH